MSLYLISAKQYNYTLTLSPFLSVAHPHCHTIIFVNQHYISVSIILAAKVTTVYSINLSCLEYYHKTCLYAKHN